MHFRPYGLFSRRFGFPGTAYCLSALSLSNRLTCLQKPLKELFQNSFQPRADFKFLAIEGELGVVRVAKISDPIIYSIIRVDGAIADVF